MEDVDVKLLRTYMCGCGGHTCMVVEDIYVWLWGTYVCGCGG